MRDKHFKAWVGNISNIARNEKLHITLFSVANISKMALKLSLSPSKNQFLLSTYIEDFEIISKSKNLEKHLVL